MAYVAPPELRELLCNLFYKHSAPLELQYQGIRQQYRFDAALQSFAFNRELTPPESLWRRRFERKMSHARTSQFY
ncbi:MAG TPA: hypothetical protein VHR27_05530 [Blastocatellia bacterium]|nr:hypothetical protein [Blastocatellia bacterium]